MSIAETDIQSDEPGRTAILTRAAEKARCRSGCRLLGGYSVTNLADIVYHSGGDGRIKSEVLFQDLRTDEAKLVDWLERLHAIEDALDA